ASSHALASKVVIYITQHPPFAPLPRSSLDHWCPCAYSRHTWRPASCARSFEPWLRYEFRCPHPWHSPRHAPKCSVRSTRPPNHHRTGARLFRRFRAERAGGITDGVYSVIEGHLLRVTKAHGLWLTSQDITRTLLP